ncbi:MAG: hypothetical protein KAT34_18785 [Candidatus Aminicenantes bacterium]|nr:hypothetical protein [Candidatus Aminicenantes bacterium]
MKKITGCFVFFALVISLTAPSFARISQFTGLWKNSDPNTRGITKLRIQATGASVTVHAWSKCHPKDCDRGEQAAKVYASSVSANLESDARALTVVFSSSGNRTLLAIHTAGTRRLKVDVYKNYQASSKRTNYNTIEFFEKVSLPVLVLKPKQVAPVDGIVFHHYPRRTTLKWTAVPGARSYTVEHQFKSGNTWSGSVIVPIIRTNGYTFNFVGAQPGRWRVWAIRSNGLATPKTGWWHFRYTR